MTIPEQNDTPQSNDNMNGDNEEEPVIGKIFCMSFHHFYSHELGFTVYAKILQSP